MSTHATLVPTLVVNSTTWYNNLSTYERVSHPMITCASALQHICVFISGLTTNLGKLACLWLSITIWTITWGARYNRSCTPYNNSIRYIKYQQYSHQSYAQYYKPITYVHLHLIIILDQDTQPLHTTLITIITHSNKKYKHNSISLSYFCESDGMSTYTSLHFAITLPCNGTNNNKLQQ